MNPISDHFLFLTILLNRASSLEQVRPIWHLTFFLSFLVTDWMMDTFNNLGRLDTPSKVQFCTMS